MLTCVISAAPMGKRCLRQLGRLLVRHRPDVAHELMGHLPEVDAPEQDLTLIPVYFDRFCRLYTIDPQEYAGGLRKGPKSDKRKIFIASMLHLYNPVCFKQSAEDIQWPRGFVGCLSDTLGIGKGSLSKTFRKVIIDDRIYDHFHKEVQDTLSQLKATDHGPQD